MNKSAPPAPEQAPSAGSSLSAVDQWIDRQSTVEARIDRSIVIPAYNEEWRLPATLVDMIDYFDARGDSYELVVVDDGSSDNTVGIVEKFRRIRSQVRLIRLPRNYGKGHAVRTGILNARGVYILFADADGSTPIKEIERLEARLDSGDDIAFGSRALRSEETNVKTVWYRKLLGRTFNLVVNSYLLPGIADTQCGFKMFKRPSALYLFSRAKADGFSFDLEILYLARRSGQKLAEVPVNWTNVAGSKVNLVLDALRMLRDMFIFRFRHHRASADDFQKFLDS